MHTCVEVCHTDPPWSGDVLLCLPTLQIVEFSVIRDVMATLKKLVQTPPTIK